MVINTHIILYLDILDTECSRTFCAEWQPHSVQNRSPIWLRGLCCATLYLKQQLSVCTNFGSLRPVEFVQQPPVAMLLELSSVGSSLGSERHNHGGKAEVWWRWQASKGFEVGGGHPCASGSDAQGERSTFRLVAATWHFGRCAKDVFSCII